MQEAKKNADKSHECYRVKKLVKYGTLWLESSGLADARKKWLNIVFDQWDDVG